MMVQKEMKNQRKVTPQKLKNGRKMCHHPLHWVTKGFHEEESMKGLTLKRLHQLEGENDI